MACRALHGVIVAALGLGLLSSFCAQAKDVVPQPIGLAGRAALEKEIKNNLAIVPPREPTLTEKAEALEKKAPRPDFKWGTTSILDSNKKITKASFRTEIADKEGLYCYGLMFKKKMPADQGMVFLFDTPAVKKFWMRHTFIPLDILFIDASGKIVKIARNSTPLSDHEISSGEEVLSVLEINARQAEKRKISVGDSVQFQK